MMPNERMTIEEYRNQPKPHKYGARATVVDGIKFASRKEADRYAELKLLERAGKVRELRCQVRYPLEVNGVLVTHYVADFVYWDEDARRNVVEDTKGFVMDSFRIKAKLFYALTGIEILIS